MNKKIISFIFIVIISIVAVIFTYNNDFMYKDTIMKITNIKTIKEDVNYNTLGIKEKHYDKELTGIIVNGKNKGSKKTIKYEETYSSIVTDKYRVNDKVFIKNGNIEDLKRDYYVVSLIVISMIFLYLIGKFRGLLAIISAIFNTIIFYFGISLYSRGVNLLFLVLIESIMFTIISIYLSCGRNEKSKSTIISVFISVIFLLIMSFIIIKSTNYKGINFNEISFLTIPPEAVILPEFLIGSLGAIMDVAITMSSSISELIEKDNKIKYEALKKSSKEIGKDIMSTMINVLFFTYLSSGLPRFVLALRNGYSLSNYITDNFSLELSRFLIGSIGIVITIPIAFYVSCKIFKRGDA